MILDSIEAISMLSMVLLFGWWKTFVAALLLKYTLLAFALHCAECVFRLRGKDANKTTVPDWLAKPLGMWLKSHRLAMDMLTSAFIFSMLSPGFFWDRFRSRCCPSCSLHHLFLFRDAGQLAAGTTDVRIEVEEDAEGSFTREGTALIRHRGNVRSFRTGNVNNSWRTPAIQPLAERLQGHGDPPVARNFPPDTYSRKTDYSGD